MKTPSISNQATAQNGYQYLYGRFCSYSSSSGYSGSYSSSNSVYFDGYGNFKTGSESYYSGGNGDGYANTSNNDNSGSYSVSGNTINLIFSDNSTYTLKVYFRQSSGEITEIQYGKTIYAKSLCD